MISGSFEGSIGECGHLWLKNMAKRVACFHMPLRFLSVSRPCLYYLNGLDVASVWLSNMHGSNLMARAFRPALGRTLEEEAILNTDRLKDTRITKGEEL